MCTPRRSGKEAFSAVARLPDPILVSAEHFLHPEAELGELEGALHRPVARRTPAVGDHLDGRVELDRRALGDLIDRHVYGLSDVALLPRLRAARVDQDETRAGRVVERRVDIGHVGAAGEFGGEEVDGIRHGFTLDRLWRRGQWDPSAFSLLAALSTVLSADGRRFPS